MQTELVDRARRGDREAFSVLAGRSVDRLYGIARLILRDTELAEDATQDALVRAWRDCPNIWAWVEDTESFPQEVPLRVIAVDVGDEHLVFTIFGEADNPDWPAMADELIDTFRFEPAGPPEPSPTGG